MKKVMYLLAFVLFTVNVGCSQQKNDKAVKTENPAPMANTTPDAAIMKIINDYVVGTDSKNLPMLESSLNKDYRATLNQFMGGDGVTIFTRDAFVGLVRDGKIGGLPRKMEVINYTSLGQTAVVQLHTSHTELIFDSFLTFVQDKSGKWSVLSEAIVAKPQAK